MQKDSNNIDQNTVVDKTNAILILCFLYSKLTALQIEEINQTDDTLNIDNSDNSVNYFNDILDGKTEINYQVIQQCIFLADQAPIEQLAKVADYIYEHLKDDVNFSYSSQALDKANPKTTLDKLNICLAVTAFELCVEEHETKSGKLIYGFCLDQKGLKRATVAPFDKYTFYKNGWFVRLNNVLNIQDGLLNPIQQNAKEVLNYVSSANNDVEPISRLRGGSEPTADTQTGSSRVRQLAGTTGTDVGEAGEVTDLNLGLSDVSNASNAGGRNSTDESASTDARPITTADDSNNGRATRINGLPIERERNKRVIQSIQSNRSRINEKEQAQLEADKVPTEWCNAENIDQALPYLLPEQRNDVVLAETRLIENKANGMLFTNNTGTGKTFTALGNAKRFVNAGKDHILIVTLSDKICKDFIKSGKPLNLDIYQLENIQDNGGKDHNIVVCTYANFAQNKSLAKKKWDLILVDESHTLMQSSQGKKTSALDMLHALTGHHGGFYTWFKSKYSELEPERDENGHYIGDTTEWNQLKAELQPKWIEDWENQAEGRAKVIFLSATPFAYDKTVEWGEGYLFHYSDPKKPQDGHSKGYNQGDSRSSFFIENFGYSMRYNKLTKPDKNVNSGVQERMFAEKLKNSGAMAGRDLVINHDYDRKFVLIKSKVGALIDEGLDYLSNSKKANDEPKFPNLSRAVSKRFDYLSRRRFLEAIKANEGISFIKRNLALNRKVIIFHDYNDGGSFSPFASFQLSNGIDSEKIQAEFNLFKMERPDLVNLKLSYASPIITLTKTFPDAMLFNGRVSKKQRQNNVDLFNDDESGKNILIVQSDAGSTGISLHDTTGTFQRVNINIGQPTKPAKLRQTEGRIYRVGQASNAIQRYLTTGTNWERSAFADTIAGRAETVDNLAKGDDALVSIKEAIIKAYEEADYNEPSENDGIGGKEYDIENAKFAKLSLFDKAMSLYYAKGKNKQNRNNREGKEWYATPEPLGCKMIEWAGVHIGDSVLEPSAGDGAIGRFVPQGTDLTMIEPTDSLASRAKMANTDANVIQDVFENINTVNKYHAIVMNPPFGNAGSLAIKHIEKAFQHLHDGGRIVALIPNGAMESKIEKFMEREKEAYTVAIIQLPPSTFENAGTKVSTRIVIIEKHEFPEDAPNMRNIDLSSTPNNTELFEAIRYTEIVPRKLRIDEQLDQYGLSLSTDKSKYVLSGYGLNDPIIKKLALSYFDAHESGFNDVIWSYNRSKDLMKKIRTYESENKTTLVQEKQNLSSF
ncbi:MAG: hypothetical protein [Bacteriophage sp.]|nr:MAG: hypothetical protein [Bacteriophage sp.]